MGCGTGLENCDGMSGTMLTKCNADEPVLADTRAGAYPRGKSVWQSYIMRIDSSGKRLWARADAYREDDAPAIGTAGWTAAGSPSSASEWLIYTSGKAIVSVNDEVSGVGILKLKSIGSATPSPSPSPSPSPPSGGLLNPPAWAMEAARKTYDNYADCTAGQASWSADAKKRTDVGLATQVLLQKGECIDLSKGCTCPLLKETGKCQLANLDAGADEKQLVAARCKKTCNTCGATTAAPAKAGSGKGGTQGSARSFHPFCVCSSVALHIWCVLLAACALAGR